MRECGSFTYKALAPVTRSDRAVFVCQINGRPATVEQLSDLAFGGYGHFTSMQVRGHTVVGLELHLERLRASSIELFGAAPGPQRLRSLLRGALAAGDGDASAQINVFSHDAHAVLTCQSVVPDVLVRTSPPVVFEAQPLRVRTIVFERFLPHVKHVDTLALTLYARRAGAEGFDDALFVTPGGQISEGTIWSIAFQAEDAIVWPAAPSLCGITQQLVRRGLDRLGVHGRTESVTVPGMGRFAGAAFMNSWSPAVPIAAIDAIEFPASLELASTLKHAYAQIEPDTI